ncbi:hypothetical protein C8J57DRAFT_1245707 [Mycena rebaudengoi]|nr:hypothetical protein C8J57DRAFT_1245707 [Mycena rebaudengoi]
MALVGIPQRKNAKPAPENELLVVVVDVKEPFRTPTLPSRNDQQRSATRQPANLTRQNRQEARGLGSPLPTPSTVAWAAATPTSCPSPTPNQAYSPYTQQTSAASDAHLGAPHGTYREDPSSTYPLASPNASGVLLPARSFPNDPPFLFQTAQDDPPRLRGAHCRSSGGRVPPSRLLWARHFVNSLPPNPALVENSIPALAASFHLHKIFADFSFPSVHLPFAAASKVYSWCILTSRRSGRPFHGSLVSTKVPLSYSTGETIANVWWKTMRLV